MKNKKLSRKDFIIKSSKCIGGIACLSVSSSIINSCTKPTPLNNINSETEYISECPCHLAQFDQNGDVIQNPTTGESIDSLEKYNAQIIENEIVIEDNNNSISIIISNYPNIQQIGGTISLGSNDIDSQGILLYRKSQSEIIALSRKCTHTGCTIGNFKNI